MISSPVFIATHGGTQKTRQWIFGPQYCARAFYGVSMFGIVDLSIIPSLMQQTRTEQAMSERQFFFFQGRPQAVAFFVSTSCIPIYLSLNLVSPISRSPFPSLPLSPPPVRICLHALSVYVIAVLAFPCGCGVDIHRLALQIRKMGQRRARFSPSRCAEGLHWRSWSQRAAARCYSS